MKKSRLLGAVCACLITTSFSASAAVVNANWKTAGDNLLTHDEVTGLKWLDLTETTNISRDYVLTQLGTGGDFEGFHYATSAEVVILWSNFGIDLSAGSASYVSGHDNNVLAATSFLGNTLAEYEYNDIWPVGALGLTADGYGEWSYERLGAYFIALPPDEPGTYYDTDDDLTHLMSTEDTQGFYGHYLVMTSVPIPPAIWLFGSGLLGLVGIARRKQ